MATTEESACLSESTGSRSHHTVGRGKSRGPRRTIGSNRRALPFSTACRRSPAAAPKLALELLKYSGKLGAVLNEGSRP